MISKFLLGCTSVFFCCLVAVMMTKENWRLFLSQPEILAILIASRTKEYLILKESTVTMKDQREIILLSTKKGYMHLEIICIGFCRDFALDLFPASGHHITSTWATAYKNKH